MHFFVGYISAHKGASDVFIFAQGSWQNEWQN